MEIKNDPHFKKWIKSLKPATANIYGGALFHFCEFTGFDPSELIKQAYEDYDKFLPPYRLRHIKYVDSFQIHLQDSIEYANLTKITHVNGVRRFYKFYKISTADVNGHNIPTIVTERYMELPVLKQVDVRSMVNYFERNKLIRAVILTAFSTGQAQDDIYNLKGRHLKNVRDGVAIIKKIRGKTKGDQYVYFIPPEALAAIHEYKPHIKDDEFVFTIGNGNKMYPAYAGKYISRMEKGLGWVQGYAQLHRVRQYWKTKLTGKMDRLFLEHIMGHKTQGVEGNYFVAEAVQDEILAAYLENLHLLTVFTDKETLQKENDTLKVKQSSEIDEIRKNYQMLQEQMTVMNEFFEKFGSEGLKMIEGVDKV